MFLSDIMRLIGHLESEAKARRFGDYLAGLEIKNELEGETDGSWGVWVYSEEQIEASRQLFEQFKTHPDEPKYSQSAGKTAELLEREEQAQTAYSKKVVSGKTLWDRGGMGLITTTILAVSVMAAFISKLDGEAHQLDVFRISQSFTEILPEVRHGEVWRLITPIFIHFGVIHLLFNMLMLIDLGSRIESREHPGVFIALFLTIAILSNLGQYFIGHSTGFGGMSGVVYGFFGYIWIRSKSAPFSGYLLDSMTVMMMLVWFFFCFQTAYVANWAHAAGLLVGMAWGALPWVTRWFSNRV